MAQRLKKLKKERVVGIPDASAEGRPYRWQWSPTVVGIVAWKHARLAANRTERVLVKLLIPLRAAIRCNGAAIGADSLAEVNSNGLWPLLHGHKCRAEAALVLGRFSMEGKRLAKDVKVTSHYAETFEYREGAWVKPEGGFNQSMEECEAGIHFYTTRRVAHERA